MGAAYTDLRFRRVFNRWLLPGFIAQAALLGPKFFLSAFLFFFPVYLLFRLRLMGAGDGKVIMLIGGSLGPGDGLSAVFLGFLAAALFSLFKIFREKSLVSRLLRLRSMALKAFDPGGCPKEGFETFHDPGNSIPLAAFLAAGTFIHIFFFSGII